MHFTSTLAGLLLLASSSVAVPRPQSSDTAQVQPPPNKFKILRLYAPANGPTTDKSEQFEIDLRRWEDPDDKKLHCKGSVKYPRKADEAAGGYGEYLNGCDKGLDVAIYFPNGGAAAVNGFQVQIKLLRYFFFYFGLAFRVLLHGLMSG